MNEIVYWLDKWWVRLLIYAVAAVVGIVIYEAVASLLNWPRAVA